VVVPVSEYVAPEHACTRFPDKVRFRTYRHADKVAVSKSYETGKHTTVYYCSKHEGGCSGYHLSTTVQSIASVLYGHGESTEGDDT
jgi:hypothetical protein